MFYGIATCRYQEGALRAHIGYDLCRYYLALFRASIHYVRYFWVPRHGAHLSIYLPHFHGNRPNARFYHGKSVTFGYDSTAIYRGGAKKGFEGYYVKVISPDIDQIKKELGIYDPKQDSHFSLFSDKHEKLPRPLKPLDK